MCFNCRLKVSITTLPSRDLGKASQLLPRRHFHEDAKFQIHDMLPFEKVLRKPVPATKQLWPIKPPAPKEELPYAHTAMIRREDC